MMIGNVMLVCETWMLVVERMAAVYGTPLPKELLALGDREAGWRVVLNATDDEAGGIDQFECEIEWNGWPAGFCGPSGGTMAAGELANEVAFREWLKTAR